MKKKVSGKGNSHRSSTESQKRQRVSVAEQILREKTPSLKAFSKNLMKITHTPLFFNFLLHKHFAAGNFQNFVRISLILSSEYYDRYCVAYFVRYQVLKMKATFFLKISLYTFRTSEDWVGLNTCLIRGFFTFVFCSYFTHWNAYIWKTDFDLQLWLRKVNERRSSFFFNSFCLQLNFKNLNSLLNSSPTNNKL